MPENEDSFATWNELAVLYEEKFMHLKIYNAGYDALGRLLPQTATVLELGCGPGNIGRYLKDSHPKWKYHATDYAPGMVAIATRNLLSLIHISEPTRPEE
jgi:trans-aconitate methyltransferase